MTPFGQTTAISSSLLGASPPSGGVTAPLTNLGKTITLPGDRKSDNVGSRTCAKLGLASASTDIISNIARNLVLPLTFTILSLSQVMLAGRWYRNRAFIRGKCGTIPQQFL